MRRRFYSRQSGGSYVSVIFDKSISNPANITIEDDESVLDSILSQFRRCLCKKTADGEVAICYLDDNNSNYYEDGTDSVLTGEEGDVMVNFPEFWYKWIKIDDNKFSYRFALCDIDGDMKHIKRSLLGAYRAYTDSDKIYSISGIIPSEERISEFNQYCNNRGSGYQIIDFQQHCTIAFMLYAKYKTRNLRSILGNGGVDRYDKSSIIQTGSSNINGISDTEKESSQYVCGLGIEGVYGGGEELVGGVTVNNNIFIITDPDGSVREITAGKSSGTVAHVSAEDGPFFDMVPTGVTNWVDDHYMSYYYQGSYTGHVVSRSGPDGSDSRNTGVAFMRSDMDPRSWKYSRIAFRGIIHEIQKSSEFKSLPLL